MPFTAFAKASKFRLEQIPDESVIAAIFDSKLCQQSYIIKSMHAGLHILND